MVVERLNPHFRISLTLSQNMMFPCGDTESADGENSAGMYMHMNMYMYMYVHICSDPLPEPQLQLVFSETLSCSQ